MKYTICLTVIILLGFFLRTYNLNWDQGFHLHPDERAITMFLLPLQFPNNWNPHFFAYGSLPLYLLRLMGNIFSNIDPAFGEYGGINILGRLLSAFFDVGTLILIFLLGKKIFNKLTGILASFLYSVSVLPIQLSHFYAVDTILTFFVLLTLYNLTLFYEKPTFKKAVLIGLSFGFALATKISATVLIVSIGTALVIDFLLIFLKNPHRPKIWFPHLPKLFKRLFSEGLFITFIILEPYLAIDFKEFWQQTMQQQQMTYNAFTFPYTLQYVGKIPYFYELKNIFFFGQGPLLATISFLGTFYITYISTKQRNNQTIILLVFFWIYFFLVGNFAIGFMRYMLPIYPILSLFGATFILQFYNLFKLSNSNRHAELDSISILSRFRNPSASPTTGKFGMTRVKILLIIFVISIIIWPLAFLNIYTKPNTRVLATEWIHRNIPSGKTLAVEHWDDSLPLFAQEKYKMITLPFYDPDTPQKWKMINEQLLQTDYIIIASNRLYTPLQKLTNCKELPAGRCYKQTAEYYKKLFGEQLGFKKIVEFSVYPLLEIRNLKFEINDSSADESFTVYDHPKVIIFKKYDKI